MKSTTKGWVVCIDIVDKLYVDTFGNTRAEAISKFIKQSVNKNWHEALSDGYKCIKATMTIETENG